MCTLRSPLEDRKSSSNPDLTKVDKSEQLAKSRKRRQIGFPKSVHTEVSDSEDLPSFRNEILSLISSFKEDSDKKFDLLTSAIQEMTSQNKEILKIHEKFDKIIEQTTATYQENKAMFNSISLEHKEALLKISSLEEQVEELQRNQRSSTLELKNVPRKDAENLVVIVKKLHDSLKVDIRQENIKSIYRNNNNKVNSIVVEYQNQQLRNKVVKASKDYNKNNGSNKMNASVLGFHENKEPVYVNELLTPSARRLYAQARTLMKTGKVKFCWVANGRIFIRASEDGPAIHVRFSTQIEELQGEQYQPVC